MKNKILQHPGLFSFFLGWLTVAALPPFYIFPVLFVTFPLLLWLLEKQKNFRQAFKIGYAFGFAFFAFGFIWIGNALLIEAKSFGWLYPIVWLACGAFFGLFAAFPAALSRYAPTKVANYVSFVCWWVVFEWLRSWFLTGFPWNLIGTALAFNDNLLQAASFGGTYFLSFLLLLLAGAPYLYLSSPSQKQLLKTLFFILFLGGSLYGYGYLRLKNTPLQEGKTTLRIVQPSIPQTMKWNEEALLQNLRQYVDLSLQKNNENIDFTIWGETAVPFPQNVDNPQLQQILPAVPPHGYLITGLIRYTRDLNTYKPYNSMFVINPQGQVVGFYDKSHLVPFGEYIPLREYLPSWIRPLANVIGTFGAGNGPQNLTIDNHPSFGGLICYEVIFPGQIIDRASRPEWLVNLTNDGWYGDSSGPRQHLVSARLRAVEEGITVARVANTGISALISPYGQIIKSINLNQSGFADVKLPSPSQFSTTYSRFRNLTILLICGILLLICHRRAAKNTGKTND